tara:strand:- start:1389 stop:1610 length:222 start_codon:yes stop_codon:yes gene_type:complete
MNSVTKEKTITLNLTLREAQAILSASQTFFAEQVKPLKEKNRLSSFWILLYKDYEKGINKAGEQYDKQISKGE